MKIYTSYFGNIKKLIQAGITPIGISQYPPIWFGGVSMKELAPHSYMLSSTIGPEEYKRLFKTKILACLKRNVVVKKIEQISGGKDVALICFEKEPETCHRSLVAEWLNEGGIKVEEYYRVKPRSVPEEKQGFLF